MNCKSCKTPIPSWARIKGRLVSLSKRRYCLTCSPFGKRTMNRKAGNTKRCPKCRCDNLTANDFYTRRKKVGIGNLSPWCKECSKRDGTVRQRKFKEKCVKYKGGACCRCGYSKCFGALEFHHRDPAQKDFSLSRVRNHKWTKDLQRELNKCDLLCANCHRETHEKLGLS